MLPDELIARIDATAARTGRSWRHVFGEIIAHYELQEQDRRAADARRRAQQFLAGKVWGGR